MLLSLLRVGGGRELLGDGLQRQASLGHLRLGGSLEPLAGVGVPEVRQRAAPWSISDVSDEGFKAVYEGVSVPSPKLVSEGLKGATSGVVCEVPGEQVRDLTEVVLSERRLTAQKWC